jgi:hypothetical protein
MALKTVTFKMWRHTVWYNMKELRFSQRWHWRMPSSGMWHRVDLVWTDFSEKRIASIFRVEKNTAATCSRWFLVCGFFHPEDGGDTFLWNVGSHKTYTAPYPISLLTFRGNVLAPSSWFKRKPASNNHRVCCWLSLLNTQNEGSTFLRHVCKILQTVRQHIPKETLC